MTAASDSQPDLWQSLQQQQQEKAIYKQVVGYAFDYLDTVNRRSVAATADAVAALSQFDEPIPDTPQDVPELLRMLNDVGGPATSAQMGGRYFGFVNGGSIPASTAARWLADVWDQNGALSVMSPVASKLEQVCERWLVELFGLPEGTVAGFVSGTSTATMCGLLAGRNRLLQQQGWNVIEDGLFGAPPIKVVTSTQAHGSVRKALALIGIGRNQIHTVPSDDQGRLDAAQLPPLDNNTLVILQAGNVNSGAFDPFETVCTLAREAGAWVHVDGAFGLWAAPCAQTAHLTKGVELADSWSVDGHKTLNAPYDSGIILCRDQGALVGAMQADGAYLQFGATRDSMLYTPEMSRRARGIDMWALLKSLGRSGVDALIARLCDNATLFAAELTKHNFRILNDVVFNQVIVACETPELTVATMQQIQQDGVCWCGGSQWQGEPVIRVSVCSWVTTPDDVRLSAQAFADARATTKSNHPTP